MTMGRNGEPLEYLVDHQLLGADEPLVDLTGERRAGPQVPPLAGRAVLQAVRGAGPMLALLRRREAQGRV